MKSTVHIFALDPASKKTNSIQINVEVTELPPPNQAPTMTGVESQLTVEVVENYETGEIEDGSILEYKSPKAKDPDGDDIKISISGDTPDWGSFKANSDGSFTLSCDRSLLTEDSAGDHMFIIIIGDQEHPDLRTGANSVSVTVTIVYTFTEPIPEPEEEVEETDSADSQEDGALQEGAESEESATEAESE